MAPRPGGSGATGSYITTSSAVVATPGAVLVLIALPGTAVGTAVLRDGGAAGAIRLRVNTLANGAAIPVAIPAGLDFETDIYLELTGAGTAASVVFKSP